MQNEQLPRRDAPPNDSYFVVGESRTNLDNSITRIFGSFYMGFVIDRDSEAVTAFNCTHTMPVTEDFLRILFLGAHFPSIDEWLECALDARYGGSSKRAVLASYRDALKRYRTMRKD